MQTITIPGFTGSIIRGDSVEPSSWRKPSLSELRFYAAGPLRSGKSSLFANNPDALIVDCERKLHLIDPAIRKAAYMTPDSWTDITSLVEGLCKMNPRPYKQVVFDSVDELLASYAIEGVTAQLNKRLTRKVDDVREYGSSSRGSRGWDFLNTEIVRLFRDLGKAGYGWAVCGHLKEVEETREAQGGTITVTVRKLALAPMLAGLLSRLAYVNSAIRRQDRIESRRVALQDGVWRDFAPQDQARIDKGETVIWENRDFTVPTNVLVSQVRPGENLTLGGNVRFPPEVWLPRPETAWADLETAYTQHK